MTSSAIEMLAGSWDYRARQFYGMAHRWLRAARAMRWHPARLLECLVEAERCRGIARAARANAKQVRLEAVCTERKDGAHCACWWDEEAACCACGARSERKSA